ncbi:MAG TPA: hypothetical protein VF980_18630, partial [Thermoanaerobaculia bacterium]
MRSKTTVWLAAAIALTMSCHEATTEPGAAASTATKSDAPRNVRTQVVSLSTFQRTINTTGTVAFNQNRSTQVLSPISGP